MRCFFFYFTFSLFIISNINAVAENPVEKLQQIHSKLNLIHGSFTDEYPEQLMAVMFIKPEAKVLELGGNMGRNSCVIASILNNQNALVTLESNMQTTRQLKVNRDHNSLNFHIEPSALSKTPLIQSGDYSIPGSDLPPGFFKVETITFQQLERKYNIIFDTLVADCEGALYFILQDDPDILNNMKLLIIENDYTDRKRLDYVQNVFRDKGFQNIYTRAGGWEPCYNCFYQVWSKS